MKLFTIQTKLKKKTFKNMMTLIQEGFGKQEHACTFVQIS